jgi:hypothetical protein
MADGTKRKLHENGRTRNNTAKKAAKGELGKGAREKDENIERRYKDKNNEDVRSCRKHEKNELKFTVAPPFCV